MSKSLYQYLTLGRYGTEHPTPLEPESRDETCISIRPSCRAVVPATPGIALAAYWWHFGLVVDTFCYQITLDDCWNTTPHANPTLARGGMPLRRQELLHVQLGATPQPACAHRSCGQESHGWCDMRCIAPTIQSSHSG
jgi:hypothetical protein